MADDEPTWLDGLPGQRLQDSGSPVTPDSRTWNFIGATITVVNGIPTLDVSAGTGDVNGPASAINNEIAIFSGATGKLIKSIAGLTVSGTGSIAVPPGETVDTRDVSADGIALDAHLVSGAPVHNNALNGGAAGFQSGTDKAKSDQYPVPVAKGDILAASTGGAAFVILSVGTNGQFLRANSVASAGVEWTDPPIEATQIASATGDTTTTSATDVVMATMTITPGAGTYFVNFGGSVESSSNNDTIEVNIYANAVISGASERRVEAGNASGISNVFMCQTIVTVGAGQAIEGRWRRIGAGTATSHERTLIVIPAAP